MLNCFYICIRREVGMYICLMPTSFCRDEVVGCCTRLTEECLKKIGRSVYFSHHLSFSSLCRPVLCLFQTYLGFQSVWFSCSLAMDIVLRAGARHVLPLPVVCQAVSVREYPVVRYPSLGGVCLLLFWPLQFMDLYELFPSFSDANDASRVVLEEKSSNCLWEMAL